MAVSFMGLKVKVIGLELRSQFETRSVGPRSLIEDRFLVSAAFALMLRARRSSIRLSVCNVGRLRSHTINKKHLKNDGPIRYCEPPLHCQSPGVASRTPAIAIAQYSTGGVRCPRHRRRQRQRQRVTEGTAMAPWNGPNKVEIGS